jgi:hypothetical protein
MNDTIKLPENEYSFKKHYSDDKFSFNENTKPIIKSEKSEKFEKHEKDRIKTDKYPEYSSIEYNPKRKSDSSTLTFCNKELQKKHKFELDMFKLSDYEFVNWANQQPEYLIMAVMAEMKKSPRLRDEIERLRPEIYKIPLMPIHEYKKLRKLGDRYASFLRQLKHEYGNHLLRLLYLTST